MSATAPARTDSSPSGFTIELRRTGGFAGLDDQVRLTANGDCTVTRKGQSASCRASPETATRIAQSLDRAGFFSLAREYQPAKPGADQFKFQITYRLAGREHSVSGERRALPPALLGAVAELESLIG